MINSIAKITVVFVVLTFVSGCGGDSGPDVKKEFVAFVEEHIQPWEVRSFKLLASENAGTETQPVYQARFDAVISPSESLYSYRGRILDTNILEEAQAKGNKHDVHGMGAMMLYGGEWQSEFHIEKGYPDNAGLPLASFAGENVIMGTSSYRQFLTEVEHDIADLREAIDREGVGIQTAAADYEALRQALNLEMNAANRQLAAVRQEVQEAKLKVNEDYRQKMRADNVQAQSGWSEVEAKLRGEYQATMEETEREFRAQVQNLRDQRARLQKERTEKLNEARRRHTEAVRSASSTMSRDQLRAYRAELDGRFQTERQEIEAQHREQGEELRAKEQELSAIRNESNAAAAQIYREKVAEIREQSTGDTRSRQSDMRAEYDKAIAELDKKLADAQNEYRFVQGRINRQLTEAQGQLKYRMDWLEARKSELQQANQLMASLTQ